MEGLNKKMENNPIYILIDELKSSEIERKKESIRNIATLAIVLGPDNTRNELLSNITELIEEKEVLMEFLKKSIFKDLLHFIGGAKHVKCIFDILQNLSTREDEETRAAALEIFKFIIEEAKPKTVQDDILEISIDLLQGEWYTSKMSGLEIALFMIGKDIRENTKRKLIKQIVETATDIVYPVRKAVAVSLPKIIELIPIFPQESVKSMVKELITDVAEVVKTSSLEGALLFIEKVRDDEDTLVSLFPYFLDGYTDSFFMVRKLFIEQTKRIINLFGGIRITRHQIENPTYEQDNKAENEGSKAISQDVESDSIVDVKKEICDTLKGLLDNDLNKITKKAIAGIIFEMCNEPHPKEEAELYLDIASKLFEILKVTLESDGLRNSEDRSFAMILLSNLPNLSKITEVMKFKKSILDSCTEILEISDWREKSRFLQELPKIAEIIGMQEFTDVFLEILKESLSDRIYIVRQQAIAVVNRLTSTFGVEWFIKFVIFYLYAFKSDKNYLHRQTPLFCLKIMSHNLVQYYSSILVDEKERAKEIEAMIDFLCENCQDKVANIRYLAIETLDKYQIVLNRDQALNLKVIKQIRKVFKAEKDAEVKERIKSLHKTLKTFKS
ncbi:unnamed protein product [Moneuplotes crassus]|uniref:Uncharacterized protein n=1 Tax=Euplotes crassus TaxID=5936 RepID=A0AAD1U598_EUPCR|nr:unnamed protein product [Moneuplotes crassus]